MLKELAKLSGGMLFLGGHVTNWQTARLLAHDESPLMRFPGNRGRRRNDNLHGRDRVEPLMLAAVSFGSFLLLCSAAFGLASV